MKKLFLLFTFLTIIVFTIVSCEISTDNEDDDDDTPTIYTCYLTINGSTRQLTTFMPTNSVFGYYYFHFSDTNGYSVYINLPNPPAGSYVGANWTGISNLKFYIYNSGTYDASYDTTKIFTLYNIQVASGTITGTFSGELSNNSMSLTKIISGNFSIGISN
jgi:hypothetical protein